jgi:hypothetical protein
VKAADILNLLIGVAVLGLLITRQLQPRPVRSSFRLPLIIGLIGLVELFSFVKKEHGGVGMVASLAGSLVIAAVLGAIRARTVQLWLKDGQPWRKGTWLTAVLWIVSLAAHLGYDSLVDGKSGLGTATILLYLAVTFAAQRLVLQARADQLRPVAPASENGQRVRSEWN